MKVGVPKELRDNEYRVAITPAGAHELVVNGHSVLIERGAGRGSGIEDADYEKAGAHLVRGADAIFYDADMVLKVKEPVAEEFPRLREGLILFAFLHLAASKPVTHALIDSKNHCHRLRDG
jgi:alanine dehydrogenase